MDARAEFESLAALVSGRSVSTFRETDESSTYMLLRDAAPIAAALGRLAHGRVVSSRVRAVVSFQTPSPARVEVFLGNGQDPQQYALPVARAALELWAASPEGDLRDPASGYRLPDDLAPLLSPAAAHVGPWRTVLAGQQHMGALLTAAAGRADEAGGAFGERLTPRSDVEEMLAAFLVDAADHAHGRSTMSMADLAMTLLEDPMLLVRVKRLLHDQPALAAPVAAGDVAVSAAGREVSRRSLKVMLARMVGLERSSSDRRGPGSHGRG
jgi:hypothetical protein